VGHCCAHTGTPKTPDQGRRGAFAGLQRSAAAPLWHSKEATGAAALLQHSKEGAGAAAPVWHSREAGVPVGLALWADSSVGSSVHEQALLASEALQVRRM